MARLKLTAPLARHFGSIKPMEPRPTDAPFDDPEYFYQIKWDGIRILAFVEKGRVRLQNRKGRDRTAQFPELQQLAGLISSEEALLDGEVVVMEGGKPSFPRVIQRDFCQNERTILPLSRKLPCTYCLFDLLFLDGEDLTGEPLVYRQQLLSEVIQSRWPLYLNENFSRGISLYRRVEELELEGIVAKNKRSPYLLGQKSEHWLKVKPRRRLLCIVGGLKMSKGTVGAILLGAYANGVIRYLGRAGSGLTRRDLEILRQYSAAGRAAAPPFADPPREKDCLWLEPRLTVVIEFAEWTPDLKLRAPVVVGFSTRPPEDAVI